MQRVEARTLTSDPEGSDNCSGGRIAGQRETKKTEKMKGRRKKIKITN